MKELGRQQKSAGARGGFRKNGHTKSPVCGAAVMRSWSKTAHSRAFFSCRALFFRLSQFWQEIFFRLKEMRQALAFGWNRACKEVVFSFIRICKELKFSLSRLVHELIFCLSRFIHALIFCCSVLSQSGSGGCFSQSSSSSFAGAGV